MAKNATFQFGGSDGFVVGVNSDGATANWIVKACRCWFTKYLG
jgi:hypothetical protein